MKKAFLLLAMSLVLLTPSVATALPDDTVTTLSNKDVLTMVQNHVPEEAILSAIKSSPCTFDTFPPVLKDMKRRGVPEAILQAMVEAPYGPAARNASKDDLKDDVDDQPIYHYADQLKQMGYISPSTAGRSSRYARQSNRTRASRSRRQ